MKLVIDRVEGEWLVAQMPDGDMVQLPLKLLPGAKDGDVIVIEIDQTERIQREQAVEQLMNELFSD